MSRGARIALVAACTVLATWAFTAATRLYMGFVILVAQIVETA